MRLYITTWQDAGGENGAERTLYEFTGTQADQKKLANAVRDEGARIVRNQPIEVPNDKARLIEFLNTLANHVGDPDDVATGRMPRSSAERGEAAP